MEEIVKISLDNEMDLIMAHKRTMRLAELCGLSLSSQTTFATAVSEIARSAIGHGKKPYLLLGIDTYRGTRKQIAASVFDSVDLSNVNAEAFSYAKRLMGDIQSLYTNGIYEFRINYVITFSGTISPGKIATLKDYFKSEPPLSPYDEIRKKNIQLIELSEKIKASENQYRLLTETLPLMMFAINAKGEMTFTNRWLRNTFNHPEQTAPAPLWYSLLHPDDHKSIWPEWERALTGKVPFKTQGRIRNRNSYEWHLITIVPVINPEKELVNSWIGFFADIHAQKLVEETLKDNKELKQIQAELLKQQKELEEKNITLSRQNTFIETVIDASVDFISVLDTEHCFITYNQAYERFTGVKKEDAVGKHVSELFPGIEKTEGHKYLRLALEGNAQHVNVYYSEYAKRFYEMFYVPLKDANGNVYGLVLIGHDITDRIENEQKLKVINNELLVRNNELEQFAYVASHDLQEPLRKIKTYTGLLLDSLEMDDNSRKHFDKIISSSERMGNLIKDVLTYSRLARTDEHFVETDLNTILDHVKTDFELLIMEKQAVIRSGTLPVIKCVPLQISQLFSNLISNSIKFTVNPPVIEIGAEKLSHEEAAALKLDTSTAHYRITVQDNGIGFEPQFAKQIFTIFQRLHPEHKFKGTGIGLAICKRVIENHKGTIEAASETGRGTRFTITLPSMQAV